MKYLHGELEDACSLITDLQARLRVFEDAEWGSGTICGKRKQKIPGS